MRNQVRTLLVALVAAVLVTTAWSPEANANDRFSDPGAYLTLAGMNGFEHFQDAGEDFDNSWGFVIRGGYRFNRFLAFEGALEFASGYEVDIEAEPPVVPVPVTVPLTIDGGTGTGNVKLYAPWFGRIQPYGLVGIGGQWARLRSTYTTGWSCSPGFWYCQGTYTKLGNAGAFTSKFGGGIELWLSDDMAIVVDAAYNLPTGDLKDLRSTTLAWGAVFQF